jgi:hypothetical protein
VSYASEPYVQFVDDLLTALTGGVIRDEFRFLPENEPYLLHAPGPPVPSTVRISGQAAGAYRRFQSGKDYKLEPDFTVAWLDTADAVLPDPGTVFYANYEYNGPAGVNPPLTDRNPGSVTRLLAESFAREYAVLSRQLEGIYNASFVETATGRDLDQIGLLVGVERRTATFAIGSVVFFRSTPSPADIFIPAGTRVSTGKPPAAQFETQVETTLRRGSLSAEALIQALASGPAGVVAAQAISVINSPILGIDGVSNAQATGFQSASETDDQLRHRIERGLEGAGQATPGALLAALTTIPGVREKDVQIVEDPISRPGVIQLNVALPQLPNDAQLDPGVDADHVRAGTLEAQRLGRRPDRAQHRRAEAHRSGRGGARRSAGRGRRSRRDRGAAGRFAVAADRRQCLAHAGHAQPDRDRADRADSRRRERDPRLRRRRRHRRDAGLQPARGSIDGARRRARYRARNVPANRSEPAETEEHPAD